MPRTTKEENRSETLRDKVFQALSDPTRRSILSQIARCDLTVAELREPYSLSAPAISKHLKVLESASLIERVKDGKQRRFKLNTEPLRDAKTVIDQLASFWSERLSHLQSFLDTEAKRQTKKNNQTKRP
ncbi:metalloregulator ArsR/SmtB family transcription factor [Pelagicoccus sp. SDUM812003]|uniref:ArsR/SmtB family transcription factor n=1 Tax=Pelagicoccus sp. SDUM812003 TaxID=3041267 RepID=UPI00280E641F|nr:metalloregulator ArsR/SmtB family transcription factor [Pelagicoccus sp. SDUM812003]MDQ8203209.1 metalloregulator ArsR/SmtB family transcription factor [Pelagicoccus sp. SDUM812003]